MDYAKRSLELGRLFKTMMAQHFEQWGSKVKNPRGRKVPTGNWAAALPLRPPPIPTATA